MKSDLIQNMLLIKEPSVMKLFQEINDISLQLLPGVFICSLIVEYFTNLDFIGVIKKLLIALVIIASFQRIHVEAVDLSLSAAAQTLNKVSPRNLFVKRWTTAKVNTKDAKDWNILGSVSIPNLNDLLGTGLFLLSKIFIWLLKLIYSTVYHLTYVFSGITAVLYLFGWTKDSLKGTVQASIWCMLLPFVLVGILSLVGNSVDARAMSGKLLIIDVDMVIWLFGITLLLLMTPMITFGLVRGDGIQAFGASMGNMVVSSGLKAGAIIPLAQRSTQKFNKYRARKKFLKERES